MAIASRIRTQKTCFLLTLRGPGPYTVWKNLPRRSAGCRANMLFYSCGPREPPLYLLGVRCSFLPRPTFLEKDVNIARPKHLKEVVTPNEFANRLGVTPATILRWERDGRIPRAQRLGQRVIVWSRASVDQWFNDGMPQGASNDESKNERQDGNHES